LLYKARAVLHVYPSIEEHASKVYTRAMFEQFGHNLFMAGSYRIEEVEKGNYIWQNIVNHRKERSGAGLFFR
jgi:hypothetical protein